MEDITWTDRAFGREGELARLNAARNDPNKHPVRRKQAEDALQKIRLQLKDQKLMTLRVRLIKAARAGDEREQSRIQQQMREHTGEDRETGLYD